MISICNHSFTKIVSSMPNKFDHLTRILADSDTYFSIDIKKVLSTKYFLQKCNKFPLVEWTMHKNNHLKCEIYFFSSKFFRSENSQMNRLRKTRQKGEWYYLCCGQPTVALVIDYLWNIFYIIPIADSTVGWQHAYSPPWVFLLNWSSGLIRYCLIMWISLKSIDLTPIRVA